ncbi:MAG: transcriptional regulator [Oscillospiraceae bacterium]|nr:transcriptional regulator [Oscillospiraceae bacterium]
MPKSTGQKLKLLYLKQILLFQTDENHKLTVNELIKELAKCGISAERKTIYDDIEALRQYGLDIVTDKSKINSYYIGSRDFELPELKLLADAVQSSKFITEKKSLGLIKKLEGLASAHEAGLLQRQVFIQNRVKSMNESIYYSVDSLHEAISEGKKISFKYFDYDIQKKRVLRKGGEPYIVSPVALTWNDENYYLIAHANDLDGFKHFRVDRMSDVQKRDEVRSADVKNFNPADYSKKVFGMFGGEDTNVKLRVHNRLIGAVIDRFGKDVIMVADGQEHFMVNVSVARSPVFFGWLFQFGELCEVLSPQSLKDELKARTERFLQKL